MLKKKKNTARDNLVMVKSVQRTRSRRMKFCVYGGLGDTPTSSVWEPNGYPEALLAPFFVT